MCERMRSLYPNSIRLASISALVVFGLVGRIDTAKAQGQDSLTVSPSSYAFTATVGGSFQSTTFQVGSSAAALSYTLAYSSTQNWFIATANSATTPATITVTANPGNLSIGTYTGTITLTPSGASTTPVTIQLSLSVVGANSLTVTPNVLSFSAVTGSTTTSAAQTLTVSSGTNNVPFTASVAYSQPASINWLQVSPLGGVTSTTLSVAANPTGLATGTYNATITIATGTGSAQVVNVTYTVTGQPTLSASVTSIPFFYQIGQSQTAYSTSFVTISSGGSTSVPITLSTSIASCPGFLGVSQQGLLTTPATVEVYVAGLGSYTTSQTCTGSVNITSSATTNATLTIPVTLTISNNPLVVVSPLSAAFTYQAAATLPANQNLTVSSTTSGLPFTASSSQPWLTVTPSGVTSSSSQVSLSLVSSQLASLIPGTYQASVVINAIGASNSPVTVPVTLTVSANSMLTFSPPFANFVYESGQGLPNTQSISIGTTGGQIPFAISVPTSTSAQFVSVNPISGIAPTTVIVSALPGNFTAGVYTNSIVVTPTSSVQTQTPQTIPVQLTVSSPGVAQLNASPQVLNFTYAQGQTLASITPQVIALTSTDPSSQMTISNVSVNSSWLTTNFAGSAITTPQSLLVTVTPTFLTPSATPYTTTLTISAVNAQNQTSTTIIQVSLNYTSGVTLTASPAALTFAQVTGGALPATQAVSIGASGTTSATLPFSVTVSTVSGVNWLTATPTTGTAPASVTVGLTSTAATLSPGTYTGSVVVYGQGAANPNGTLTIPVTLTVAASPTLTASPVSLTFSGTLGGSNPAPLTIQVGVSNSSAAASFTAAASTVAGNWLSVTPTSGTTPATLTASANLSGLNQGTYTGTITLTPAGGGASTTVQVSLTVGAQALPALTQVINAASGVTGSVSPGEIVSIFGTNLGPSSAAGLTLNAQGNVSTSLSGVTVTFNGTPAPLTYVSATQINCVVPYEVANATSATLTVTYNGVTSGATSLSIIATQPGIFTQNSSGAGAGAILEPNYSLVTPANPAPRGSTIIIYATGGGVTTPAGITGAVAGSTLLHTAANVNVTIGGVAATVSYAGSAPGLVEGVLQINAIVPTGISAGVQPILVTVGTSPAQNGVTVAVQ